MSVALCIMSVALCIMGGALCMIGGFLYKKIILWIFISRKKTCGFLYKKIYCGYSYLGKKHVLGTHWKCLRSTEYKHNTFSSRNKNK